MSDDGVPDPDRVRRAFRDYGSFERAAAGVYESTTTPFDARVAVEADGADLRFEVAVEVPMLSETVEGDVAGVVEDGWYETFERRIAEVGGITRGEQHLDPTVRREDGRAVVEASFAEVNERRGVDDAGAFVDFVEGTYVQGVIPGYDYVEPTAALLSKARGRGERA